MSSAFLIAAVVVNAGFALVVFWWVIRELRRGRRGKPALPDRPGRPR